LRSEVVNRSSVVDSRIFSRCAPSPCPPIPPEQVPLSYATTNPFIRTTAPSAGAPPTYAHLVPNPDVSSSANAMFGEMGGAVHTPHFYGDFGYGEAGMGAESEEPQFTREERVARYREKRQKRNFNKTIRYQSRKVGLGAGRLPGACGRGRGGVFFCFFFPPGGQGQRLGHEQHLRSPAAPGAAHLPSPRTLTPSPPAPHPTHTHMLPQAYAEIRPRIKGRFVSPEEYAAYVAAKSVDGTAVVPSY
jgi:hypothetical protein